MVDTGAEGNLIDIDWNIILVMKPSEKFSKYSKLLLGFMINHVEVFKDFA